MDWINTTEIVKRVSNKHNIDKDDVDFIFEAVMTEVVLAVDNGEKVRLNEYFDLFKKDRTAKKARNINTGESLDLPAGKKMSVKFLKRFLDLIKNK